MYKVEPGSLLAALNHEPQPLKFGTSGRRGEVVHLTQLEIYLNVLAELEYLQSLPSQAGGIVKNDEFYFACDLRPSAVHYVSEANGRGEIAQAVVRALQDAGMKPVYLGHLPTPALMAYAIEHGKGSIMVTGSHIPFDRNGYKTNTAKGELLKKDEAPIGQRVEQVRARIYAQPFAASLFDEAGQFKTGHQDLPPEQSAGRLAYHRRYLNFFTGRLTGLRLLAFQHSAVGRDILVEVLQQLGAEVIPAGRSETFVPIDTENVDEALLARIQMLVDEVAARHGPLDAVVSTDGDSDRPLILGVTEGKVRFYGGDLIGMIVAEYLGADAVVVPISCNDAIDRGNLRLLLEPKTRIGSPHVIAGMDSAKARGKLKVCGWEANGGFLTGSDFERDSHRLTALPTRDALLPILGVLFAAKDKDISLRELFRRLPQRFSKAALLKNFPRVLSQQIIARFSPSDASINEVDFSSGSIRCNNAEGETVVAGSAAVAHLVHIKCELAGFFSPQLGFGEIVKLNFTDGVRINFANGDVAQIRPSGNADEFRIYAVADTQARADAIANAGVAEPADILRKLADMV